MTTLLQQTGSGKSQTQIKEAGMPFFADTNRSDRLPLMFVQLNEINFDVVRLYIERFDDLPNFRHVIESFHSMETRAERDYSELEPWIQWVSAQTGKTFQEHGVFRLGDIVKAPQELVQIFEALEDRGLRVGAISPMNARNRLRQAAYFVPDPWTDTPSDGSGFSRRVTEMLRQSVNDNATGRLTARSKLTIVEMLLRSFSWKATPHFLSMLAQAKAKPWTRALVLDELIHLVHRKLWKAARPDATFVFLNAGAHVQHHYFFNAEPRSPDRQNPEWYIAKQHDPVRDMLKFYDRVLSDYIKLADSKARLFIATGLSQVPYDRVKFYYRLKSHEEFLRAAGVRFLRVLPRMTRDFEIFFENRLDVEQAALRLSGFSIERTGGKLFGDMELRDRSLFLSLTYPQEIVETDVAVGGEGVRLNGFGHQVAFVAIKNGMHSTRGFAFLSPNCQVDRLRPGEIHVSELFHLTLDQFQDHSSQGHVVDPRREEFVA